MSSKVNPLFAGVSCSHCDNMRQIVILYIQLLVICDVCPTKTATYVDSDWSQLLSYMTHYQLQGGLGPTSQIGRSSSLAAATVLLLDLVL